MQVCAQLHRGETTRVPKTKFFINCRVGRVFETRSLSPFLLNTDAKTISGIVTSLSFSYGKKTSRRSPFKGGTAHSSVVVAASPSASGSITVEQKEMIKLGTALRNIGWLSFWSQLVLTLVSAVILLFSTGVTSARGSLSINPIDACTLGAVAAGIITTGLSWTWIRVGRRLASFQDVRLQQCVGSVLASTNLNLIGMGAAILGLQATVGGLVAKTLSTAAGGYYGPRAVQPPVAFDVFSVQACANSIMAHFAGLVLGQWLLRILNRYVQKMDDINMVKQATAPPMPYPQ